MEDTLKSILEQARTDVDGVRTRAHLEAFKAGLLGPNGSFTGVLKSIGGLPAKQRPAAGKLVNEVKQQIEALLDQARERIEKAEAAAQLGPPVDPTLPSPDGGPGTCHLLTRVCEEICTIFHKAGFVVAEGSEVETEYYCFDALNTPPDHPARDLHDTYYLPAGVRFGNISKKREERYILRTHTSSVQIRTMLQQPPPLSIISPGRCFRRDTADATHSANFHQVEGLFVDRHVTVKDLRAILDYFVHQIFGKGARTRLRPSFFPFTEPSFEMDFNSPNLGKLSDRWIEIMGCGMVDPVVFEEVGYDPEQWTGYAFGMGIERIAMILHGIDDIRHFYQNDLRFLRQFA